MLIFESLPLVAQPRFAFFDAALEIDFDLRAGGVELAAGTLDLFLDPRTFVFDLVDLELFEPGKSSTDCRRSTSSF